MPTLTVDRLHDQVTERSNYRYLFTAKHHGGNPGASMWLTALSLDDEFRVFDLADQHELCDDDRRLYGVWPDFEDGTLRHLGDWNEQVAEFPNARDGEPWHGYPVYPLQEGRENRYGQEPPENRRGQECRPDGVVFKKMLHAFLITKSQKKRLMKGDHV